MTPVFLNLPSSDHLIFSDHHQVEQKDQDQQLKLFINNNSQYNYEASSSLSSPATFFNSISTTATTTQDLQSGIGDVFIGSPQLRDQKAVIDDVFTSRSKNLSICQRDDHHQGVNIDFNGEYQDEQNNISSEIKINYNNGPSVKYWMSSKLRLMQKMSNQELPPAAEITSDHKLGMSSSTPSEQDQAGEAIIFNFSRSNSTSTTTTTALPAVRVCSDCNTTSTPLWRSGPRGPKSLCNACGIRQRKARRAMAEAAAANGLVVAADYTPIKTGTTASNYYKTQFHINKEKKSRISSIAQYKNKLKLKLKLIDTSSNSSSTTSPRSERKDNVNNNNNKLCLSKFSFGLNDKCCSAFSGVFPKDVAEAAVLLMEMSCGFVHS